jgi:hypothetical protein
VRGKYFDTQLFICMLLFNTKLNLWKLILGTFQPRCPSILSVVFSSKVLVCAFQYYIEVCCESLSTPHSNCSVNNTNISVFHYSMTF